MKLGILGCMAQNRGPTLNNDLRGVDLIVGTQKFHRVSEYLDEIFKNPKYSNQNPLVDLNEEEGSQNTINQHLSTNLNQVSAFVSIMQGCNMNCSFCIVPKTRGKERYRNMDEICNEILDLRNRGVREVTLLGQIVNAYGRGVFPRIDGKSPFVQLLEKFIQSMELKEFASLLLIPHPLDLT